MATITEVTGKSYKILVDATAGIWHKISMWTKASDVYNNSNKTLETTCGSITGITSSLTSTSTTMAASASAIKELNDKIADLNSNLGWNKITEESSFVDGSSNLSVTAGKYYLIAALRISASDALTTIHSGADVVFETSVNHGYDADGKYRVYRVHFVKSTSDTIVVYGANIAKAYCCE